MTGINSNAAALAGFKPMEAQTIRRAFRPKSEYRNR